MPGSILGNRVRRVEDPQLLTGAGRYVGDIDVPGLLHLALVRSTVAHGVITDVDASEATGLPGVVAVRTSADLDLPRFFGLAMLNERCARPPLAVDRVRFVGEPVAAVVAESLAAALDATESVFVDIDPLDAVVDPEAALAHGAPLQFPELGSNLASGAAGGADDPLGDAEVVVRGRFENQRIAVAPIEPDAVLVDPQPDGGFVVHLSTQMPHGWHSTVRNLFGLEADQLRVVAPFVGGAFGGKAGPSAEHLIALGLARELGRPVRWVQSRTDNLVGMNGRGQVQYGELGLRRDGTITGLRCRIVGDAGSYAGFGGALALGPSRSMAQGPYRIPQIEYAAAAAMTNTAPVGAFRGAGRPEATALLERLMDLAARELDLDPVEVRRRNLLDPDEFPYRTRMGTTYDCGDYQTALDEAVRLAGYDEARAEQARRREAGDRWQLGIGVCTYVEVTAGGGASEFGAVEVHPDGTATIRVGTSSHGQGHATSFAMIVADRLGIDLDAVRFVQSDTAVVPRGGGTGGSRSLQIGGSAVLAATEGVLDKAKALAAARLEADPADIVAFGDGTLGVAGVPARSVAWGELAAEAAAGGEALAVELDQAQSGPTFPFGAHVSIVEVDVETGLVRPVRHVAVDDCGRVLNPLIVEGQQHGGIAQGMAQALWEQSVYDEDGNPLTATFADYAIPAASELPSFETANTETPTPLNALGAKGIGESGTIGALPAVHGAVLDALQGAWVDMPCTPERVWRALQSPADSWREPPAIFETLPRRGSAPRPPAEDVDI